MLAARRRRRRRVGAAGEGRAKQWLVGGVPPPPPPPACRNQKTNMAGREMHVAQSKKQCLTVMELEFDVDEKRDGDAGDERGDDCCHRRRRRTPHAPQELNREPASRCGTAVHTCITPTGTRRSTNKGAVRGEQRRRDAHTTDTARRWLAALLALAGDCSLIRLHSIQLCTNVNKTATKEPSQIECWGAAHAH